MHSNAVYGYYCSGKYHCATATKPLQRNYQPETDEYQQTARSQ